MLACDSNNPFSGTKETFISSHFASTRSDSFPSVSREQQQSPPYYKMYTEGEFKETNSTKTERSSPTQIINAPSPNQPNTDSAQIPTHSQQEHVPDRETTPEITTISPSPSPPSPNIQEHSHKSPFKHSPHTTENNNSSSSSNSSSNNNISQPALSSMERQQQSPPVRHHSLHRNQQPLKPSLIHRDDVDSIEQESQRSISQHHYSLYQQHQSMQQLHQKLQDERAQLQQEILQQQLASRHHHHHHQQHRLQQQHHHQQQQQQQHQQQQLQTKDMEFDLNQDKGNLSDSDSSVGRGMVEGDTGSNKRFRDSASDNMKDETYWEKRRRNNEAAQKSREKRRIQDMALKGRINCLEDDNGRLRRELSLLKKRFNLSDSQGDDDQMDQDVKEEPRSPPVPTHSSRNLRSPPPPIPSHSHSLHSSSSSIHNSNTSNVSNRSHVESNPPPLLTVAGAIHMGMAVYPSPGPALPYFFPEAPRMTSEVRGGSIAPGIPTLPTGHHVSVAPMRRTSLYPPMDVIKQEKNTNEDIRIRERSNSNIIDCRPSYQMEMPDMPTVRRGSVGNYVQYGRPASPPMQAPPHHAYPSSLSNRSNHGHFLQRPYESASFSHYNWSQRSPASSNSSDDYDEPLQLTVRRDSNISNQSAHSGHSSHGNPNMDDPNSLESDHGVEKQANSGSPPASSFPLKLRHKLPPNDLYPKDVFPGMSPSVPGGVGANSQPSFPSHHPFINGLAHLSDMAMGQTNPLSLMKKETFRQRRDSMSRAVSRRNPLDQKYLDPKYLERRRRNNEAARKCRENRKTLTRIREVKSDYLENENNKLRDELNGLQEEMKQLRELIEKKRLEKGIVDDIDQKPMVNFNDIDKMETEMYKNQ